MGRHGDCASLEDAVARKEIFQGVEGPHDFTAKLHRQGRDVRISEIKTGDGSALTVNVPELGLSLIFVHAGHCAKTKVAPESCR